MRLTRKNAAMPILTPRLPSFLLATAISLCFSGCGNDLRGNVIDPDRARDDHRAMRLKVVAIVDNFNHNACSNPHISHVIDCDVIEGPADMLGKPVVLPYDAYLQSKEPPAVGSEVVTSPADWVNQPERLKFRMREK